MYKNWSAIIQLDDPWLKLFVSLCEDAEQLRKLSVGFPELFTLKETEKCVPLSALLQKLPEFEYSFWHDVLDHFEVPYISWGGHEGAISTEVPKELWDAYMSLPYGKDGGYSLAQDPSHPFLVEWKGQDFLVVEAIRETPGLPTSFWMTAKRFINLEA